MGKSVASMVEVKGLRLLNNNTWWLFGKRKKGSRRLGWGVGEEAKNNVTQRNTGKKFTNWGCSGNGLNLGRNVGNGICMLGNRTHTMSSRGKVVVRMFRSWQAGCVRTINGIYGGICGAAYVVVYCGISNSALE